MPARSQRRSFPERQVREHLEGLRDEGLAFEDAYVLALRRVDWPHETHRRRSFRAVFLDAAVKAEWRACYEGTRTAVSELIDRLAPVIEEPELGEHVVTTMGHFVRLGPVPSSKPAPPDMDRRPQMH